MTTKYAPDGKRWGSTVVEIPAQMVEGKRDKGKHGYEAAVVKVQRGKGPKVQRHEVRGKFEEEGEVSWTEILKVGDKVKVSGTSKGKGFAGVVKRYNFKGGPRTHGQSDRERARGSSGSTTTPGRVYKGKRMAGRMGGEKVTMRNLGVLEVDVEKRLVYLKGAVPGSKQGWLTLTKV